MGFLKAFTGNKKSSGTGIAALIALGLAQLGLEPEVASKASDLILGGAVLASLFLQRDGDK